MTRMEAEFVQREAPPSYGQLITQGLIPPVEDFPVYNPTQVVRSHTGVDSGAHFPELCSVLTNYYFCNFGNQPLWCNPDTDHSSHDLSVN